MTTGQNEKKRLIMVRGTTLPRRHSLDRQIPIRNLCKTDAAALGELLYAAYHGTVDDEGETPEETSEEAHMTFAGRYGEVIWGASYVVHDGKSLLSATVVTDYEKLRPLLAFVATRPEAQGKGHASMMIQASTTALRQMKIDKLHLVVTEANDKAVKLYRNLGFVQIGEGSGNA